jgi:hypothetical protein
VSEYAVRLRAQVVLRNLPCPCYMFRLYNYPIQEKGNTEIIERLVSGHRTDDIFSDLRLCLVALFKGKSVQSKGLQVFVVARSLAFKRWLEEIEKDLVKIQTPTCGESFRKMAELNRCLHSISYRADINFRMDVAEYAEFFSKAILACLHASCKTRGMILQGMIKKKRSLQFFYPSAEKLAKGKKQEPYR